MIEQNDGPATTSDTGTPRNEHLSALGFRVEHADTREGVDRLLEACDMEPLSDPEDDWEDSQYLVATTRAGGIAACIGWNRGQDAIVLHSLAVAPSSRRNRVGASLFATAIGDVMDAEPVSNLHLVTDVARGFFASFGFEKLPREEVPDPVRRHPIYEQVSEEATRMIRRYDPATQRGLDQYAFRLVHNTTEEEATPPGSVFFFQQSGPLIEANYRGEPVERGHLIGAIDGTRLEFLWHQYAADGELMQGDGQMYVDELPDGRRELREKLGDDPGELLLREV
jgi:N-acetylglutamate synthase-like GNAT family acetyltransferase